MNDRELKPVAWITTWNEPNDAGVELHWAKQDKGPSSKHTPLYYAPPQREWQGLMDEETELLIREAAKFRKGYINADFLNFAKLVAEVGQLLKEKNT